MESLEEFLRNWEMTYDEQAKKVGLFDPLNPIKWSAVRKTRLAKLLYHARGHFDNFLFRLGSYAPDARYVEVILANIRDEFGLGRDGIKRRSHELLYIDFFNEVADVQPITVVDGGKHSLFLREFNRQHLRFVHEEKWEIAWSAFCAYERLDNLDYENLYALALRLGVPPKGLVFFEVHRQVEHYEATSPLLKEVWEKDRDAVEKGFAFIAQHQLSMWRRVSESITKY